MARWLRFGGVLVLAVALAAGLSRLPETLSRVEWFRVRHHALEGARFLSAAEVARAAELPADASVWDEFDAWEANVRNHPLVREVRIERDLPATLVFRVEEREPVALVPNPTLEPVDAAGRVLPLDPARHRLDLPLIRPVRSDAPDTKLTPEELRGLARELERLARLDPGFVAAVSRLGLSGRGHVVAELVEPRVEMLFRTPLAARRLHEGLRALAHARVRAADQGRAPRAVDLRYEDQVVVRLSNPTDG